MSNVMSYYWFNTQDILQKQKKDTLTKKLLSTISKKRKVKKSL